jgi:hypothetical protein
MHGKFGVNRCAVCAALLFLAGTLHAGVAQHTVSINSDGRDELRISNGNLVVHHFSWGLPTDLTVNGVARPLTWNGNTSDPVAVPITGDYWVRKSDGRDGAYAVQRADGFALAVADNPNGNDLYEFEFSTAAEADSTEWMRVLGGGATPGRMDFVGTPGYVPQAAGTETTFSLNVDGTDELLFVNGSLVVRHLSFLNPTSLTINGVPQALTFNGNTSEPIPLNLPDRFQFEQLDGRTTLYPLQTPAGLVIGADDELLGPDVYSWRIVAIPEPAALSVVFAGATGPLARRRRRG